jgi:large subunit ribosomal protein L15
MQFHNLKKNKTNRKAKQVGRGGARGKTSGRGTKGQNARAGRKKRPEMRDIIKRLPKLRGRGKNFLKSRLEKALPINISRVQTHFKVGEEINAKTLLAKGLIKTRNGRIPKVKNLNG